MSIFWILTLAITSGQLIKVPFGTQSITFLDITVSLFCLIGILKSKFQIKKPPRQITAALIFILVAILSLAFTPLHLKPVEYLTSASYIVRFFLYVLFALLVYSGTFGNFGQNSKKAFLFSGIAFTALGILQFIFFPNLDFLSSAGWDPHYFRAVSTFLDPNFAGAYLVLTLILLLSLQGAKATRQSILAFAIIYIALLTTFSRSSYLMFLVSGLTLSFFKKSKILVLVTLILFASLLFGFQAYNRQVSMPRNIDRVQSASFRFNTWQQGLNLFQKFPILGIGFNAYRYGIKEYNLGDKEFLNSHGSSSNDSSLLFVLSTTGILGLAAYLYFLWALVKPLSGKNIVLISAIAGLLIHSIFANSLFYPPLLAWILLVSVGENPLTSVTPKK